MQQLKRLIHEIHRRSLWQVLAIYVGASWVVFEIVQTVTEGLGLPEWFPAFAALLLLIGLPIVLATAFVQEGMSPTQREDPTLMPTAAPHPIAERNEVAGVRRFLTWRNAIAGGVLAFALWGVVAAAWLLLAGPPSAEETPADRQPSIAVLPFENLSPDEENAYFAAGIHEDILSQLAKIRDLTVISRTSVLQYADSDKPIPEIAKELGVEAILEGSVRRAGDDVRVVTQLIDARRDAHVWSETYDRELTVANVFEIQTEIAEQISNALHAELTPEEKQSIRSPPTDDLEAYEYYLRGNEYLNRGWLEEDAILAERMYEKAIELDPDFALAYARLSLVHDRFYWGFYDRSDSRLAKQRETAERALRLEPELAEAHIALAYYYYHGQLDYDRALQQLSIARQSRPDNSEVLSLLGAIQRRQGRWHQAAENLARGAELDPRSHTKALELGSTYHRMREYAQAESQFDRAIALVPDRFTGYSFKAGLRVSWKGGTEEALEVLREAWSIIRPRPLHAGNEPWTWWLHRIVGPDHEQALERFSSGTFGGDTASYLLTKAELYDLSGQAERAEAHYDSARVLLERQVEARPQEARFHSELGVAYAGLGRKADAIREGRKAVELLPVSKDAYDGSDWAAYLALIYTMAGEYDAAIDQLDSVLSIPGILSAHWLRVDPMFDPLRDHPRFQALLEKYE